MITTEERLIYDMLLAKIGHVPVIEINNRKETAKEKYQRLRKNCNYFKAKRASNKYLNG